MGTPQITCPICYMGYTSGETHQMTSLKCGHCFGLSCITTWIVQQRNKRCPLCSASTRKVHLRPVFLTVNEENELDFDEVVQKYLEEKNVRRELEAEISSLKRQLEVFKLSIAHGKSAEQSQETLPLNVPLYEVNLPYAPHSPLIIYDNGTCTLVTATTDQGKHLLFKSTNTYGMLNTLSQHFAHRISSLVPSPVEKGICLIASHKALYIINYCQMSVVCHLLLDKPVSAACFDAQRKGVVYACDVTGAVIRWDTFGNRKEHLARLQYAAHTLAVFDDNLYTASVFDVKEFSFQEETRVRDVLNLKSRGVSCTGMAASAEYTVYTRRNASNGVGLIVASATGEVHELVTSIVQYKRQSGVIVGRYFYTVNDGNNALCVYDLAGLALVSEHRLPAEPIAMACSGDQLCVLTTSKLHWFTNRVS